MAGELTRRVGVAVVGIPAVLGLLYLGGWFLAVPVAALAALGAGEVFALAEARDVRPLRWLGMAAAAGLVLAAVVFPSFTQWAPWGLGGLVGLTGLALVVAMPARGPGNAPLGAVSATLFGVLYAGIPLVFVMLLHALPGRLAWGEGGVAAWGGLLAVMLPLAATWVGDSAAYFAGSAFGKARIAPSISPKKSWVGGVSGLVGSGVAAVLWLLVAQPLLPAMPALGWGVALGMGALMGLVGQVGDFAESMLKREAGVKDSGTLFPGHGGVLDRMDALVLAIPAAYVLLVLAELAR